MLDFITHFFTRYSPETWSLGFYVTATFGICGIMLGASWLLGGRDWGRAKHEPFESGVVGAGTTRMRLSAKFYLVAMFFVIFDLEAVFLFSWAISVKESGWAGFIEATIFIFVLVASLIYLWRIGALEWAPESRKRLMDRKRLEADVARAEAADQGQIHPQAHAHAHGRRDAGTEGAR